MAATSRPARSLRQPAGRREDASHRGGDRSGYAVNPAQIERQVSGSFVFGLSAVLWRVFVKDGAIEQTNFDTYNVLRIREMPPSRSS